MQKKSSKWTLVHQVKGQDYKVKDSDLMAVATLSEHKNSYYIL